MTAKKPDAQFQCPPHEKRKHYACLIREFVLDAFKRETERLNCSQGVYLEILLIKALEAGLVTSADVFEYDALERSEGRKAVLDMRQLMIDGIARAKEKRPLRERYKAYELAVGETNPLFKNEFGEVGK